MAPALATRYLLAMLMPKHPRMPVRTMREMRTVCCVLDLLAKAKWDEAADVLAQRLKALERSLIDENWARSQFAELIPLENATLMSKEEEYMLQREMEIEQRLRYAPGGASSSSRGSLVGYPNSWNPGGKGGKSKGPYKGKGKGGRHNKGNASLPAQKEGTAT